MTWQVAVAFEGNLQAQIQADLRAGLVVVMRAMKEAIRGAQLELRGQVVAAGLGRRLGNSVRSRVFPEQGRSLAPSGYVFSRAGFILAAQAAGAEIRPRRRRRLAVPTPAAQRIRGTDGRRVRPETWPEARFGPLVPVPPRQGKPGLLIARGLVARRGKRGGFRRATVRRASRTRGEFVSLTGVQPVVMFVLLRRTKLRPKPIDQERAGRLWQGRLGRLMLAHWEAEARRVGDKAR